MNSGAFPGFAWDFQALFTPDPLDFRPVHPAGPDPSDTFFLSFAGFVPVWFFAVPDASNRVVVVARAGSLVGPGDDEAIQADVGPRPLDTIPTLWQPVSVVKTGPAAILSE